MKVVLKVERDKIEKDDLTVLNAFAKKLSEKVEYRPPKMTFFGNFASISKQKE